MGEDSSVHDNDKWEGQLTVGELREIIKDLPDDSLVFYERIQDEYFDDHGWETLDLPDYLYWPNDNRRVSYIRAFAAYKRKDRDGLFVTAHY